MSKPTKKKTNLPVVQKHDMHLTKMHPDKLVLHYKHARTHDENQIDLIAKSIKDVDFTNPVTCDEHGRIISGVARWLAAKRLKLNFIPVRILRGLTEKQKRSLIIRDNQLATQSGWDYDILKCEFEFLEDEYQLMDFGFENWEVDKVYNNLETELERSGIPDEQELQAEDIENVTAVSREGDLWLIGKHRLLCGSCLDEKAVDNLIDSDLIRLVITDAPYNVPTAGHIRLSDDHREFAMAAGEMSPEEFTAFLNAAFSIAASHCKDGALFFGFMDWRHMREMMDACDPVFGPMKQLIVWAKNNGGMGTFYRSRHEMIFVYKHGKASHVNNFGLGENGRYRSNVWEYAGVNTFKENREEELAMHPTVKPVQMIEDAILDCSNRGDYIYDPFLGSGTAMVASENQGRICCGVEIDPEYIDVTINRMQRIFNLPVIHAETGKTYDEIKIERKEA